jgi:cell division protein FtsB
MTDRPPLAVRRTIAAAGLIFILVVLLITAIFGRKGLIEIARVRRTHAALVRDIEALKEKKARLEREIAELEQNPAAVEKEAREKLGLIKPDEKMILRKTR